jgi:glycyl-tRNA synthetase beta subunit
MTKKYTTKQTIIDEQAQQVEDLSQQVKDLERQLMLKEHIHKDSVRRIQEEARKVSDMVSPEATITVWEDHYRPDQPMTLLATIQVWDDVVDKDISGENKTDLLEEMDKLSEALSEFYSALECEIRINMSINRY